MLTAIVKEAADAATAKVFNHAETMAKILKIDVVLVDTNCCKSLDDRRSGIGKWIPLRLDQKSLINFQEYLKTH